jgi:hypothetical protein
MTTFKIAFRSASGEVPGVHIQLWDENDNVLSDSFFADPFYIQGVNKRDPETGDFISGSVIISADATNPARNETLDVANTYYPGEGPVKYEWGRSEDAISALTTVSLPN